VKYGENVLELPSWWRTEAGIWGHAAKVQVTIYSGWWFQPEKYEFVSWDDEIPN